MASDQSLKLLWSAGYQDGDLIFPEDGQLLYGSGNTLTFIRRDGSHVKSFQSLGEEIGRLSMCSTNELLAYSELGSNPRIFVLSYPNLEVVSMLKGGASRKYIHLEFSRSGNHLLAVSGLPDFKLFIWTTVTGEMVHSVEVGQGVQVASFNPLNWKQLCTLSESDLCLWNLEQCGKDYKFSKISVQLPTTSSAVGSKLEPHSDQLAPLPHDKKGLILSQALFAQSFIDPHLRAKPVLPRSHCWTPTGGIYCGCQGGQLFLVDAETGSATVLVNPTAVTEAIKPLLKDYIGEMVQGVRSGGVGADAVGMERVEEEREVDLGPKGKPAWKVVTGGDLDHLQLNRRGLYTAGKNGIIYCLDLSDELKILDYWSVGDPIHKLLWSASYDKLALSTPQGAIYLAEPFNLCSSELVVNYGCGEFIGVCAMKTTNRYCITCRSNGVTQVWSVHDAGLISTFDLQTPCCVVATLASCSAVAIGSENGFVHILSLLRPRRPTLVSKLHLFHTPICQIIPDKSGQYIVISGKDTQMIYILDARPSENFQVIGRIDVGCSFDYMTVGAKQGHLQLVVSAKSEESTETMIFRYLINSSIHQHNEEAYVDKTLLLKDSFTSVKSLKIFHLIERLTLVSQDRAIAILSKTRESVSIDLTSEGSAAALECQILPTRHEMRVNFLSRSFTGSLVASGSADGKLRLSDAFRPDAVFTVAHGLRSSGCKDGAFSFRADCLLSVGDKGILLCWNIEGNIPGKTKAAESASKWRTEHRELYREQNDVMRKMTPLGRVEGYGSDDEDTASDAVRERGMAEGSSEDMPSRTQSGAVGERKTDSIAPSRATSARVSFHTDTESTKTTENTWLENIEESSGQSEDGQYTEMKDELRQELLSLREKVLKMIAENEALPDIEKLERHEFILNTEEYDKMVSEEENILHEVTEEMELSNLAQLYIKDVIKRQCWDEMMVKGKVIKAFQSSLEVSNYALHQRSQEEEKELMTIKSLRQMELAETETRGKYILKSDQQTEVGQDEEEDLVGREEEMGETFALVGSTGAKFGADNPLLYNQFDLFSTGQMKHQIILLQDCIYNIKLAFNKEFDEILKQKEIEIQRINERNQRIAKIILDLQLTDKVLQPALGSFEKPEMLFEVKDSEVRVDHFVSEEEQKRLDELAKLEEERKLRELADNWRERALDMMMDGRLEINAEEELLKDLPRPSYMNKPPEALTEEEMQLVREFTKKEEAHVEEREKYKKTLEAELRRLQEANTQAFINFDEKLKAHFSQKISSEIAINQEELKILRLVVALMIDEETSLKESQLHGRLEEKKSSKIALASSLTTARQMVGQLQRSYELSMSEDKDLDKGFKKELSDCEPYTDQLYKLYKKRPRGQRLKVGGEGGLSHDPSSTNPFAQRPISALGGKKGGLAALAELDHSSNAPDGVDRATWDRLVVARQKKYESEQKMKSLALELAEVKAFHDRLAKEDDCLQQDIQDTYKELNKLREEKARNALNLEVQFILKQGQVEVETGIFIPDFSDSILVQSKLIEDLNSDIKNLGNVKLNIMEECKEFKKGIHMLEWDHKRIRMEAEDLLAKCKDIQSLKVTKELQKRLTEGDQQQRSQQQENEILEKTLKLNEEMSKKAVKEKKRALVKVQQQVEDKRKENYELEKRLKELQVCVLERKEIETLAGVSPTEAHAEVKMKDIVLRRRLVEMAKSQAQEIALLKAELERLRMRTFPALVQIDN